MAQTSFTPISLYYSSTASAVPTAGNLVAGELAINTADGRLFYKDSAGVVQTLATKDATSGSFTNLAYTGTLTGGTGVVNLGSGQFYKDASGNVGIGTSSPATKLEVSGQRIRINNATDPGLELTVSSTVKGYVFYDTTNNLTTVRHASTGTGMSVDASGQVLVGLTSAAVTATLQTSTSGTGTNIFVRNTNATTGYFLWGNANGADKLFCAQTGSLTNATGTYGTISDAKLKENIVDATPKLNKVLQLQVRNFNFIGDDLNQIGFIAQEIEQVFPSLVEEHIGRDEEGNENGEVTKSVKTSILLPILVKAIQEQQVMIEELKAKVAALEAA